MTWAARGQPGEPAADLDGRLAADPGVDLVEHHRRDGLAAGQADLDGQHHPGQLAAGGAALERPRLAPVVGAEQERDLVEAVGPRRRRAAVTATSNTACGMASAASSAVTAPANRSPASPRERGQLTAACSASSSRQVATSPVHAALEPRCRRRRAPAAASRPCSRPGEHVVDACRRTCG